MGITAGPLNTLRRHDPQSGVGLWTLQLDSPAVAVHLADGTSLKLHGAGATAENASSVVVGTLHGSMYALPVAADWLHSGLPPQSLGQSSHSEAQTAIDADSAAHPSVQDSQVDATSSQLIPTHSQHAQRSEEVEPRVGLSAAQRAAGLGERSQTASPERPTRPTGQSAAISTALMQLPMEASDGPEALWQCPVSLHNVVTTTAPQSFLPNLTDVGCQIEEVQATKQPQGLGGQLVCLHMLQLCIFPRHCCFM